MDALTQVVYLLIAVVLPMPHCCSPVYLPGPQSCPDTGRTLCTHVPDYPTEEIYQLLMRTQSQAFNLSSLFLDERMGDVEPNLGLVPSSPPSPTTHWTSDRPSSQTPHPERWKQIIQTTYSNRQSSRNNGQSPRSNGPPIRNNGHADNGNQRSLVDGSRQSRAQNLNTRRDWNNPTVNPVRSYSQNGPQSYDSGDRINPNPVGEYPLHNRNIGSMPNPHMNGGRNPPGASRVRSKTNFGMLNQGKDTYYSTGNPNYDYDGQSRTSNIPFDTFRYDDVQVKNYNDGEYGVTLVKPLYEKGPIDYSLSNYSQVPLQPFEVRPQISGVKGRTDVGSRARRNGNWKGSPYESQQSAPNPNFPHVARRERSNQGGGVAESACRVRSTFVPPRAALNDRSQWKFVINLPERNPVFSQVVRVDLCLSEGESCSSRFSLPFGFESRCRQKYLKKRLLSLDSDGRGTSEDNFFIPSCCVCQISRTTDKKKRK